MDMDERNRFYLLEAAAVGAHKELLMQATNLLLYTKHVNG